MFSQPGQKKNRALRKQGPVLGEIKIELCL
jgi:hypothetical protein